MRILYRCFILLCCLSIALPVSAQKMSVKSFSLMESAISANIQGPDRKIDQNGEVAALIKVRTTETGFRFDGGLLGIVDTKQDVGEIYVWVPWGAKKIQIKHQKFGVLDYWYSVPVESGRTYLLELETESLQSITPIAEQFLVMSVSPADARVYIDDTLQTLSNGSLMKKLPVGKYVYRVEASGYETTLGVFNIIAEQPSKVDIALHKGVGQQVVETPVVSSVTSFSGKTHSNGSKEFSVGGVTFKMIYVEGGTFTMGATSEQGSDAASDEKPAHRVTLSDYYVGETEVTQALWTAVMGTTVSQQRDKANTSRTLEGVGENYPMYYISWNDCQKFIKKLNKLTGQNFRLPTEAEWEYAARGGNKSKGYKYAGSNTIGDVAWYKANAYDVGSSSPAYGSHTVKTKQPNELGLYDMSGNVWEWCSDRYGSYSSGAQNNPTGPTTGSNRVYRGGGWNGYAEAFRVSGRRGGDAPVIRYYGLGLRLALTE